MSDRGRRESFEVRLPEGKPLQGTAQTGGMLSSVRHLIRGLPPRVPRPDVGIPHPGVSSVVRSGKEGGVLMIVVKKFTNSVWEIVFGFHDDEVQLNDEVLLNTEEMQELSKKLKEAVFPQGGVSPPAPRNSRA